jgi:hypothetical protein
MARRLEVRETSVEVDESHLFNKNYGRGRNLKRLSSVLGWSILLWVS